MAIVKIYGFQQFVDYGSDEFTDFSFFGKLPFIANNYGAASRFRFLSIDGRLWLYSYPGSWGYGQTDYNRRMAAYSPSFNMDLTQIYGDLAKTCKRFIFGCRFRVESTSDNNRPNDPISLDTAVGSFNQYNRSNLTLLTQDEIPNVAPVDFYIEMELDIELGVVKRWMDGVKMADIALPSSYSDRMGNSVLGLCFGNHYYSNRSDYGAYVNQFQVNDFYFVADTQDDTPCNRLGPVEIDPIEIASVTLPGNWSVSDNSDPKTLLAKTPKSTNTRDVPALVSDWEGVPATVSFKPPEKKEGDILYVELEVYGSRDYGDAVQLNTTVRQGQETEDTKTFELLPEELSTGLEANIPTTLLAPLAGGKWTEEEIGKLKLDIFTTKPDVEDE